MIGVVYCTEGEFKLAVSRSGSTLYYVTEIENRYCKREREQQRCGVYSRFGSPRYRARHSRWCFELTRIEI